MYQSTMFKGVATITLLLLMAAPALASSGHDVADGKMSQSKETVLGIQRTTAGTAAHTVFKAILARNVSLYRSGAGATGASGGDGGMGFGAWGEVGWQHVDNSSSQWSRGDLANVTGGFDAQLGDAVVGIAVGGEWMDLDMSDSGRYKSDGFTLTPNLSYVLMPDLMLDAALGLGWQDNYQKSSYISNSDNQRHSMDGNFSSWRLFTTAGLTKFWMIDEDLLISARGGAMYLYQETESHTLKGGGGLPFSNDFFDVSKDNIDLLQLSLSGRVDYQIGDFSPFASATYLQDVYKSGRQNDFVGGILEGGCNYRIDDMSMGISAVYSIRSQYQSIGGMLNFRWDF